MEPMPARQIKFQMTVLGLRRPVNHFHEIHGITKDDLVPYTVYIIRTELFNFVIECEDQTVGIYDTYREAQRMFIDAMKQAMLGHYGSRFIVEPDSDDSIDTMFDMDEWPDKENMDPYDILTPQIPLTFDGVDIGTDNGLTFDGIDNGLSNGVNMPNTPRPRT